MWVECISKFDEKKRLINLKYAQEILVTESGRYTRICYSDTSFIDVLDSYESLRSRLLGEPAAAPAAPWVPKVGERVLHYINGKGYPATVVMSEPESVGTELDNDPNGNRSDGSKRTYYVDPDRLKPMPPPWVPKVGDRVRYYGVGPVLTIKQTTSWGELITEQVEQRDATYVCITAAPHHFTPAEGE